MSPSKLPYDSSREDTSYSVREMDLETALIRRLEDLKYTIRPDIRDRASLERNFREKFQALNRVELSDGEFARLREIGRASCRERVCSTV